MKFLLCVILLLACANADEAVCSWCQTITAQIEQLQVRHGRNAVEEYINELCTIATDEAKTVCDNWKAYGMDKVVDAIMAQEDAVKLCKETGSC